jgi:putative transposase
MYDPEPNKYIEVPYRDLTRPSVSLWEVKEAKRILRADSMTTTNEELIFKTIDQMRQLVEEESVKTKSARTKKQRQKQWAQAPKSTPNDKEKIKETKEEILDEDNEDEVFEPFKGTRES